MTVVGSGETIHYGCVIHVYAAGEFNSNMDIYLEENGFRKVKLTVRGTVVGRSDEKTNGR